MPFAVHLFFDENIDQAIHAIWREMADSGTAPYLGISGNRPHISLAFGEELDAATCQ